MTSEVLDSDLAQAGGWSTVVGSVFLTIMEWLGELTVNDILQGILLIGSIIFLWYKIVNARLDARIKRKELKDGKEEGTKKT
jgi:hypothetical protein